MRARFLVPAFIGTALVISGCEDHAPLSPESPPEALRPLLAVAAAGAIGDTEVKVTASDAAAGDQCGRSVSVSGDVAVIGAIGDDDAGSNSGSAYIFRRTGTSWSEEAKLTASDAAAGDDFGRSVSVSGEVAVVGAARDDDAGFNSGSAYVFRFDGASWSQESKLTASDAAAVDQFGFSVSLGGDLAIVGAREDDDAGFNSGSAYVFRFDGASWIEEAKLTASDGAANDLFGFSVSISGDLAIVGAFGDSDAGGQSGSAYVFRWTGASWSEEAKLTASDAEAFDAFGWSVSISGDLAIVGALFSDDAGQQSGSAYIFRLTGTSWSQEAKLTASDEEAFDRFGISVSVSGEVAVVGAALDDDAGRNSGSAYIFRRTGTSWSQEAKLTASDGAASDLFGRSVSIGGDWAIVGAAFDDDAGRNSGSAYVYTLAAPTPAEATQALIEEVLKLELKPGIENALSAKLEAALASLENGRPAAIQQLEAFINQVEALRGKQLTDAEADELIGKAQDVIRAIEAMP